MNRCLETHPETVRRWRDKGVRSNVDQMLALLELANSLGLGHIPLEFRPDADDGPTAPTQGPGACLRATLGDIKNGGWDDMNRRMTIRQPFDLALSLEMGQAFRWRRVGDEGVRQRDWADPPAPWRRNGGGWYSGVLGEYLVHLRQTDDGLEYRVGGRDGERDDVDLDPLLEDHFRIDDGHWGNLRPIGPAPGSRQGHWAVPGAEAAAPKIDGNAWSPTCAPGPTAYAASGTASRK